MKIIIALVIVALAAGFIWSANRPSEGSSPPESNQLALISTLDILHASDLVLGVKQAVANKDEERIDEWLAKAIDLGQAANLAEEDMAYLRSERARKYVIFHAKRRLFSDAVEENYYALLDIEAIKAQYPQALNLFADADHLIAERNSLIQQIAAELANGEAINDSILLQAQQHWQQRFAANGKG